MENVNILVKPQASAKMAFKQPQKDKSLFILFKQLISIQTLISLSQTVFSYLFATSKPLWQLIAV